MKDSNELKRIEELTAQLLVTTREISYQNEEKEKRAAELLIANKELTYQNEEKEKRAAELLVLKDSLFNEKQLLEKTLISIGDCVISTDKKKNVVFLNKVAEAVTGWSQKEALGKTVYEVFNIMNEFTRKMEEDIVKKIVYNYHIPYLTITPTFSICPVHGYLSGEHFDCPKCKQEKEHDIKQDIQKLEKELVTMSMEKAS